MPLVLPDTRYRGSFVEAVREFSATDKPISWFARALQADVLAQPANFEAYVNELLADRFEETPRPADFVPCTTLWYVDGDDFIGRLAIRHRLTPDLTEVGGHIGYDVRPSRRRQGNASRMLAEALPLAAGLGIDPALLTCDDTNVGSWKVIEKNGGVLEDQRGFKLRFWVPTH